ncbi:basic form of pathogenesis-related protein 1-like [Arachis ipaensis]|uniref:basic form of pathogenesis-related protein 1-like n=1 Tax=Arachis ipaensis TaxID=130454 RepID=UPI0007AF1D20|nr:basic form of pathogenesis-related protein 1-like [Arachis ipaensis]XP_025684593.1 basic form of pathogenesis-related protein 1-like [Arachis hypogaea]
MEYLKGHNAARAKVGVKPLKWDKQLESLAHEFVNEHIADCYGMYIPHHFGSNYGQNIVHNPNRVSAASAVATWVAQKQNYEPKSNKCIDATWNFSQMPWTVKIGHWFNSCHLLTVDMTPPACNK